MKKEIRHTSQRIKFKFGNKFLNNVEDQMAFVIFFYMLSF